MRSYDWPGDVRELQNVLRRGMILFKGELIEFNESWMHREDLARGVPGIAMGFNEEEEGMHSTEQNDH